MTAEDRAAHVEREAVAGVLAAHRVNYHHRNVGPEPVTAENLRYTSCEGCDWLGGHRDEAGWEAHVVAAVLAALTDAVLAALTDAVLAALPQTGDAAAVAVAVALCDADTTWEHHDQTDDHPCSRCRRYAQHALADLAGLYIAGADQ